jgi:hypothetical protein
MTDKLNVAAPTLALTVTTTWSPVFTLVAEELTHVEGVCAGGLQPGVEVGVGACAWAVVCAFHENSSESSRRLTTIQIEKMRRFIIFLLVKKNFRPYML